MILILIRVDGAEGEVLRGRDRRLGQHVKEGGLADVGQTDDAGAEVRPQPTDQGRLLLHFLLLGGHDDGYRADRALVNHERNT